MIGVQTEYIYESHDCTRYQYSNRDPIPPPLMILVPILILISIVTHLRTKRFICFFNSQQGAHLSLYYLL
jgi:hypothetical protein